MGWEEECDTLKRKRYHAKGRLARKFTLFKEGLKTRGDHISVSKNNQEAVTKAFQELEGKNNDFINYICDNKLDESLEVEAQRYILSNERIRNEIHAEMCKIEADQSNTCKQT